MTDALPVTNSTTTTPVDICDHISHIINMTTTTTDKSDFAGIRETATERFESQGIGIWSVYRRSGNAFVFERKFRCAESSVEALSAALDRSRKGE